MPYKMHISLLLHVGTTGAMGANAPMEENPQGP